MNIHDATEVAYRNGYEAGVKEFAYKLVDAINKDITLYGRCTVCDVARRINDTLKELTESNE